MLCDWRGCLGTVEASGQPAAVVVEGIGKMVAADIRESFGGSNHAPVRIVLELPEPLSTGNPPPALAILTPGRTPGGHINIDRPLLKK